MGSLMKKIFLFLSLFLCAFFVGSLQTYAVEDGTVYSGNSPYWNSSLATYGYTHLGYAYDFKENFWKTSKTYTYIDIEKRNIEKVSYVNTLGSVQIMSNSIYPYPNNYGGQTRYSVDSWNTYFHESLVITQTIGVGLYVQIYELEAKTTLDLTKYTVYTNGYDAYSDIDYNLLSSPFAIMAVYKIQGNFRETTTTCTQTRNLFGVWSSLNCNTNILNRPSYFATLGYDSIFASVDTYYKTGSYLINNKPGYSSGYSTY